ncbi:DUF202 domain-containing protein [Micromonospora sp. WMMD754]|uniref:DUF202 domain-containing protein n=1 Tax=Micromonospora sp. WMMD754 TaxID=3404114 RepID=UPI003BF59FEE
MTPPRLWDAGAQHERTALAWSRTSLSTCGLLAVLVRVLAGHRPHLAVAVAVAGVVSTAAVGVAAGRRYRTVRRRADAGGPLPGPALPVAGTILTVLAGASALLDVVLG